MIWNKITLGHSRTFDSCAHYFSTYYFFNNWAHIFFPTFGQHFIFNNGPAQQQKNNWSPWPNVGKISEPNAGKTNSGPDVEKKRNYDCVTGILPFCLCPSAEKTIRPNSGKTILAGPTLKRMTAFKSRFYTISKAFGVGPMTLKVTEKLILKTLGRPGPHYFKSFPVDA